MTGLQRFSTIRSARTRGLDSFWVGLIAITGGAFALRVWYALTAFGIGGGDALFYHLQANLNADGHWFQAPYTFLYHHQLVPSAEHPPLWPLLLSIMSWLGGRSEDAHRIVACAVGAATVLVIGLIGRRLWGNRAGLVTAGFAAVYPNLWQADGLLEVGTLYALTIALVVLAALRWREAPTVRRSAVLGGCVGLATLTRSEALLIVVVLLVPLIFLATQFEWRRRLALLGVAGIATAGVLTPWFVFNAARLEHPVLLTTNGGSNWIVTNCDSTYSGLLVAAWDLACLRERPNGFSYVGDHLDQLPRVIGLRIAREWDFFRPGQNVDLSVYIRGRDLGLARFGQVIYFLTLPLAVGGVLVLRRRRRPLLPVVAMILLTTVTAAISWGDMTYRVAGEVALVILAGVFMTRAAYGPLRPGDLNRPGPRGDRAKRTGDRSEAAGDHDANRASDRVTASQ